jgi:hypothetical protein
MPKKLTATQLIERLRSVGQRLAGYRVIAFILAVALLYAVMILRINTLDTAAPSETAITAQSQSVASAHIDKSAANQLEALQNNNVNVQTLFDQARTNPFQE